MTLYSYSFGYLLYLILHGKPPFVGTRPGDVVLEPQEMIRDLYTRAHKPRTGLSEHARVLLASTLNAKQPERAASYPLRNSDWLTGDCAPHISKV